eukprot:sb/3471050/
MEHFIVYFPSITIIDHQYDTLDRGDRTATTTVFPCLILDPPLRTGPSARCGYVRPRSCPETSLETTRYLRDLSGLFVGLRGSNSKPDLSERLVTQFPLHCGHAKTCLTFAMPYQFSPIVTKHTITVSHDSLYGGASFDSQCAQIGSAPDRQTIPGGDNAHSPLFSHKTSYYSSISAYIDTFYLYHILILLSK